MLSVDDIWPAFLIITLFATPIAVGGAYDGWFGGIVGLLISCLFYKGITQHLKRPRGR